LKKTIYYVIIILKRIFELYHRIAKV